ncbi:MAG: hypothetical protein IKG21_04800, partial [Atopobiaceae bacterium]|nr:hypothetical protein [Atopobiaceae bacterium]
TLPDGARASGAQADGARASSAQADGARLTTYVTRWLLPVESALPDGARQRTNQCVPAPSTSANQRFETSGRC